MRSKWIMLSLAAFTSLAISLVVLGQTTTIQITGANGNIQVVGQGQVVVVAAATQPAVVDDGAIRIKAGADKDYVDPQGHLWAKDSGFADGDTVDRGDIKVENTTMPALYTTEHFGMTAWSKAIPNGKYTIKLHFCETFDGVTDAGQRVFTVKIGDKTLKDIDPFKDAGGALKAVVKTVEGVEVTTGTLKIEFVEGTQSPEINGIEIIPVK